MEVPFIPDNSIQKAETRKPGAVQAQKAYGATAPKKAESDGFEISSKSRLMQKLRAGYDELEKKDEQKVAEVKDRIANKAYELDSEQIVAGILSGTLFETI